MLPANTVLICSHVLHWMPAALLYAEEDRAENVALIREFAPTWWRLGAYGDGFIGSCLAISGRHSQRTTMMLLEENFPQALLAAGGARSVSL